MEIKYYAFFNKNNSDESKIFINKNEFLKHIKEKNIRNYTYIGFPLKSDAEKWLEKKKNFHNWKINEPEGAFLIIPENIPPGYVIDERHGLELVEFINILYKCGHQCGILHEKLAWCGNEKYCIH